ncbi:hypothetical protein J4727_15650, partial [Providencia rettgeri]|nr:hypothetical protein [Providencia rettgeri]
ELSGGRSLLPCCDRLTSDYAQGTPCHGGAIQKRRFLIWLQFSFESHITCSTCKSFIDYLIGNTVVVQ